MTDKEKKTATPALPALPKPTKSINKGFKKLKLWIAGIFVAIGYHFFIMAFGAALVNNNYVITWTTVADTGVIFGEIFWNICRRTPEAVDLVRSAGERLTETTLDY